MRSSFTLLAAAIALTVGIVVYLLATALISACPSGIDINPNGLVNICTIQAPVV